MPLRAASAASAKANFASGSQKRLMSQADAMRSMCGRGRVTQVLPRAGSDVRWRPPVARGRVEIVDGLDPVQLALETVELGAERRDRSAVARPVAIELREDLSTLPHDRLVFRVSDFVEQRRDLVIGHRLDAVDPEQGRLAAKRLDLLDQPLEQLGRLRRLRQDPAGAPQPDRAHALELAPDA